MKTVLLSRGYVNLNNVYWAGNLTDTAVSVNFTDGNNATLIYTVNGVTGNKTITRQVQMR